MKRKIISLLLAVTLVLTVITPLIGMAKAEQLIDSSGVLESEFSDASNSTSENVSEETISSEAQAVSSGTIKEDRDENELDKAIDTAKLESTQALAIQANKVVVSGALIIKRSEIVNRAFFDYDKSNENEAWATWYGYNTWKKAGIVDLLSKITINGQNIAPQSGDMRPESQIDKVLGTGSSVTSMSHLSNVNVLCLKVRAVPTNLPLNIHPLILKENTYTEPHTFTTTYSLDYSSWKPLFKNNFQVIDDYRQLTFEFQTSEDGKKHGRFTDEEKKISLASYQDTTVPNNVVGVVEGQSLQSAGLNLPAYKLDESWAINKITDENDREYTKEEILSMQVNSNKTFKIHLKKTSVDVKGKKIWNDHDDQDGKRPKSITIRLLKNGQEYQTKTVTEKDDWKWSFTNLPRLEGDKEIKYTITEDKVAEYSSEVKGYDVKNTHTPEKTSIKVTKKWQDHDNQNGKRPKSVTVKLLANKNETKKQLDLTDADNWTGTFSDLDVYQDGKKIVYSISEIAVDQYTSSISGDATDGYIVTNSYNGGGSSPSDPTNPTPEQPDTPTPEEPSQPDKPEVAQPFTPKRTGNILKPFYKVTPVIPHAGVGR